MPRRRTINENPLGALIGEKDKEAPERGKRSEGGRSRITISIPNETLERARDAVFWTRGETLSGLMERGVEMAIEELAKGKILRDEETGKVIKGKNDPFPGRLLELKAGRPVANN